MKITREHLAMVGILLLVLGVEMVIIQSVVLNKTVSRILIQRFYPEYQSVFMVADSDGTLTVRPVRVKVPDPVGHCVATGGLVLLLCCFITVKE